MANETERDNELNAEQADREHEENAREQERAENEGMVADEPVEVDEEEQRRLRLLSQEEFARPAVAISPHGDLDSDVHYDNARATLGGFAGRAVVITDEDGQPVINSFHRHFDEHHDVDESKVAEAEKAVAEESGTETVAEAKGRLETEAVRDDAEAKRVNIDPVDQANAAAVREHESEEKS
jgi:hypothetical protein